MLSRKMIVGKLGIPKSGLILETAAASSPPKTLRNSCCCCFSHKHNQDEQKIPKLEAFSRTKFDRLLKDPPLISKSQNQLADYCTLLEGDDSYSCWQAYFELKHLQNVYSKEEVERLIIEAGGVKSLIGCLHGVASILKANKDASDSDSARVDTQEQPKAVANKEHMHMHIPDGLPKTADEIEDEENSKMPDSAYTRLLRYSGTLPAWYSSAPDHQSH